MKKNRQIQTSTVLEKMQISDLEHIQQVHPDDRNQSRGKHSHVSVLISSSQGFCNV